MPRRSILLFAAACVAIAAALAIVTIVVVGRAPSTAAGAAGVAAGSSVETTGEARIGGPFQLVDQNGRAVDQTLLDGKWSVVFFGFTYCPDYCPTTLAALDATKRAMGAQGDDLQVIFVSVDPERDTPAALKTYLGADGFPKGVIGLTGSPRRLYDEPLAAGLSDGPRRRLSRLRHPRSGTGALRRHDPPDHGAGLTVLASSSVSPILR